MDAAHETQHESEHDLTSKLGYEPEYEPFIHTLERCFFQVVHELNFKDGAFKDQIEETTPPLDTLNIFIVSSHLSPVEKATLQDVRTWITNMLRGNPENKSPRDLRRWTPRMLKDMCNVFLEDCEGRGPEVAQLALKALKTTGEPMGVEAQGEMMGMVSTQMINTAKIGLRIFLHAAGGGDMRDLLEPEDLSKDSDGDDDMESEGAKNPGKSTGLGEGFMVNIKSAFQ